jgi:bile acid:Na+ symporter, BASS family
MTLAQLIPLALQSSIAILLFCIALKSSFQDITRLLERPGLLARSFLAMNLIMPLFAVMLALAFDFNNALEIAFIALAIAPIPPILPKKELKAGGTSSYIIGLLSVTSLVSIVLVPATVELLGRLLDRPAHVSTGTVAGIVMSSMIAPLVAGIVFRRLAPSAADRIARPLSRFANVLLVVAAVPVLIAQWPGIVSLIGDFTLVAIIAFVLVGLAVGHLLGGPDPDDRTVLALSTATRHPAVALAILHNAPDQKEVMAAVLLVVIVGFIASVPYVMWRTHQSGGNEAIKG